ncbi:MAG: Ig-like domain-containing protein [Bacteroidales bacterium]
MMAEDWVDIEVLLNDYDPDGDNIEINNVKNPKHGDREYNDTLAQYRSDYYIGPDSMEYRIKDDGDPTERSEYTYIYINVLENPTYLAENDSIVTIFRMPIE